MDIILKYFPELSKEKIAQFSALKDMYLYWNERINLVSRKDISNLSEKHILHSLFIAKVFDLKKNSKILDVGTGGGLPGIPLAIYFSDVHFHLVDSIGKKIKVVKEIIKELNLKNVTAEQIRVENVKYKYDFIVSRAVSNFPDFVSLTKNKIKHQKNEERGILYLKGGDFSAEIKAFEKSINIFNISDYFEEEYFETKKLIFLSL